MTFADNLVRLRREKGFSQEQLADLMDVSRQAVSKWEAGQTMLDLPKLVALADLFGTSLDALVRPEAVVETKPGGTVQVVTAGQTVCVPAGATVNVVPGYEYKSKHTLFGLPLVHINCGYGLRRAKGVIAIGNIATGIVALGGIWRGRCKLLRHRCGPAEPGRPCAGRVRCGRRGRGAGGGRRLCHWYVRHGRRGRCFPGGRGRRSCGACLCGGECRCGPGYHRSDEDAGCGGVSDGELSGTLSRAAVAAEPGGGVKRCGIPFLPRR